MKVSFNPNKNIKAPSFQGYEIKKTATGKDRYEFNFPHDTDKFDCYVEFGMVYEDDDHIPYVEDVRKNVDTGEGRTKIDPKGEILNLQDYGIKKNDYFAYRFILKDKKTGAEFAQVDSGLKIGANNGGEYNLISQGGSKMTKGGSAMLIIPDTYNVGWTYNKDGVPDRDEEKQKKAVTSSKIFSAQSGGTLAGMEEKISKWKEMGLSRVFSLPLFSGDDLSYFGYWNKNAMQMSHNLGSTENYASFQKKLFKAGINLVADGAFVNEGLEGVHFKHVLKWGEQSPYYYWFRINGIENGPLNLGVFSKQNPDGTKTTRDYISHKIVNSPYDYKQDAEGKISISKNKNYDRKKPTYVQIFDERLVSDEAKKDTTNVIKAYDKLNAENLTDINTHEDTIIPYKFEVEPETYKSNIEKLKELNSKSKTKISMDSMLGTRILTKFENFSLEEKFESGLETWDANTDIPKINYSISPADLKELRNKDAKTSKEKENLLIEKNFEAQDYAVSSGKYWTQKTKSILLEETARNLKSLGADSVKVMDEINKLVEKEELPESAKEKVTLESINAALKSSYDLPRNKRISHLNNLLLSGLMDLPLDAIEFGDDIVATMGTPSMTNRASSEEEIGVSRYLLHRNLQPHLLAKYEKTYMQTNAIYEDKMLPEAIKIMRKVNLAIGDTLFDEDFNASELGKYTLPIVGQDISKFLMIKALCPEAINIKKEADGTLSYSYDYKKTKETTFHSLGMMPRTPEEEVETLIHKIEKGLDKITDKDVQALVDTITKRVKDTNSNSYKVAEMILDKTSAGLDWRIDAAKDVSDMNGVRNKTSEFSESWNEVIDFWSKFTSTVLKENKNSYLVAEITDVRGEAHDRLWAGTGRFHSEIEAEQKLLQEAGMTSVANYSYFFTSLSEIFGKNNETGNGIGDRNSKLFDILHGTKHADGRVDQMSFLESDQLQSLIYSYTFAGNHDKPRLLHCLATDMSVFFAKFDENKTARQVAEYVLNKPERDIDFNKLSPKAVAVGDTLKSRMEEACNELEISKTEISNALAKLVQAEGTKADGLASKPFEKSIEFVIKTAKENHGLIIDAAKEKELINKSFEKIMRPAMSKFEGLNQFLVSLPGLATLFAGDDLGMTGYEGKSKNDYHQNRNVLNWDWLNDDNKKFIKEFNTRVNETMKLRGRAELEPLNTGTPYLLEKQFPKDSKGTPITGLLRQGSNGAMTVSLFNAAGVSPEKTYGVSDTNLYLDGIKLNGMGLGLAAGVKEGTIFKNADESDKSVYKVVKEERNGGAYFDYLIKKEGGDIKIDKPTLVLYHQPPKKETSFTGSRVLYNPQYNFVSAPYAQVKKQELGAKLELLCK